MSRIMEVERFNNSDAMKCWIGTDEMNFQNMFTISLLNIALQKIQVVRADSSQRQDADIIIRNSNIEFVKLKISNTYEPISCWSYHGMEVIEKAFNGISIARKKRIFSYMKKYVLPIIYEEYESENLNENQKVIQEVAYIMDKYYGAQQKYGSFEYAAEITNLVILNIIEDLDTSFLFEPKINKQEILRILLEQ